MLDPATKGCPGPGLRGNTRFCNNKGCFGRPSQTVYNIQRGPLSKSKEAWNSNPRPGPELSNPDHMPPNAWLNLHEASAGLGLSRSPSGNRGLGRLSQGCSHSRALHSVPCCTEVKSLGPGRGRFKSPLCRLPSCVALGKSLNLSGPVLSNRNA